MGLKGHIRKVSKIYVRRVKFHTHMSLKMWFDDKIIIVISFKERFKMLL
jgi:hypothetical protein